MQLNLIMGVRFDKQTKKALERLAAKHGRTQGDYLRWLVRREVERELGTSSHGPAPATTREPAL